jgi:predicted TIM-barrel fold metal-dependent hydrolase
MSADLKKPHVKPHFQVPAGACDCHMHVFGPRGRYPYSRQRTYTPRPASLADYRKMAAAIGLQRVVFVQPSAYGADNRCMIDAIREVGENARGVIGMDEGVGADELRDMSRLGVRGVRINAASRGLRDVNEISHILHAAAFRVASLQWHLQIFTDLNVIHGLAESLRRLPVPVVIDHFGLADATAGTNQSGFSTLCDLLAECCCWVKVSAPYRISKNEPDFPDATPIAKALIAANPDRVVWGTDWPHTGGHGHAQEPEPPLINYRQLDDGLLINCLADWAGDDVTLTKVLVHNPARLYGF